MTSIIDKPDELIRYVRHVIYERFDGPNREDFFSCAMMRVVENLPRIDRTKAEHEIRAYVIGAAFIGARDYIGYSRSILSTQRALRDSKRVYGAAVKRRIDVALHGRRFIVVDRENATICPAVENVIDPRPTPTLAESHPAIEAIPKASRERLLARYRGTSIEDVARNSRMSRAEVRAREVADMRKAGAL